MRTLSPSTASMVGPGDCAVVAPEMRLHAGRDLAHHRLGDEMEFLPVAVHAPRQRPAVERHHRLVVRPVVGASGGCIVGAVHGRRLRDRGGLRAAADAHAPASAAAAEKFLREIHGCLLVVSDRRGASGRRLRSRCFGRSAAGVAADHGRTEVGFGEPEVPLRFDRRDGRGDALARLGQQREHVDLHPVVAQQRLVRDDLAQRQHLAAVMPRDVVGADRCDRLRAPPSARSPPSRPAG